jgi:hypothetical protein
MIFLSFDIEEFDVPCDYGVEYAPEKEGVEVSSNGTISILDLLDKEGVKATFFCTAVFAKNRPMLIKRMVNSGHEIGSHGFSHSKATLNDLAESKSCLEQISEVKVLGYRQPRMGKIKIKELKDCGFLYHSSVNPTYIPGHYFNMFSSRTPYYQEGVLTIPVSVSPLLRIPMFWLSFHNFPLKLYRWLTLRILQKDGCFNTYFHPWEFYRLNQHQEYNLPYIIRHNSGEAMTKRLESFIRFVKERGESFGVYSQYLDIMKK